MKAAFEIAVLFTFAVSLIVIIAAAFAAFLKGK
jgi:hypothetical protein